jgi:hypothetical protein
MDPEQLQTIAARDQLWSSVRSLLPDIDKLANGQWEGSERERQVIQVLARIITAELRFRAEEAR